MSVDSFHVGSRSGSHSSVHILSVKGAITYSDSSALHDAVNSTAAQWLILDLSEVPSLDSGAIGALVRAFVTCNKSGRKLALAGLNHRVRNVLQLTGVDPLFEVYATVSEAESAFS
jgi:anti-sigma B factor antagonist